MRTSPRRVTAACRGSRRTPQTWIHARCSACHGRRCRTNRPARVSDKRSSASTSRRARRPVRRGSAQPVESPRWWRSIRRHGASSIRWVAEGEHDRELLGKLPEQVHVVKVERWLPQALEQLTPTRRAVGAMTGTARIVSAGSPTSPRYPGMARVVPRVGDRQAALDGDQAGMPWPSAP